LAYDLILKQGCALDPETGLNGVRDVAISRGSVSKIDNDIPSAGSPTLDIRGMVVAPGFIDLHSHANSVAGQRLQACDGVTSAMDLEGGESPISVAYTLAMDEGRPINFGFSASWALSRMAQIGEVGLTGRPGVFRAHIGLPAWQRQAEPGEVARILAAISLDLEAGGLGVGVLLGYAPRTDPAEYLAVAHLAAEAGVPVFTHTRALVELAPDIPIDGAQEIARAAESSGAQMHYCHINSTSRRFLDRVYSEIERANAAGALITTEAYPYGAGATGIGATFLDPANLERIGIKTTAITYVPTGERVKDAARLAELRASDPGGLAIHDFLDEDDPADRQLFLRPLETPSTLVASDAMPLEWRGGDPGPYVWPLPPGAVTHPRTAGTFARATRMLTKDLGFPLSEAVRRASLEPARLLQQSVPAMRKKGRLQEGCDADLIVFDPEHITDRSTYLDSTRPSEGIAHVLVNGSFVVRQGSIIEGSFPGRPIYASTSN
jgi:hypothetical protein